MTDRKLPPHAQPSDEDDRAIWRHQEGFRHSESWRLGAYGDDGILSEDEVALLIDHHGLTERAARELSASLGHCLSSDGDVAINLAKVERGTAIKRGNKCLERAIAKANRIDADLQALLGELSQLEPVFAPNDASRELLPQTLRHLAAVRQAWDDHSLAAHIQRLIETPGAAADSAATDKRTLADTRRSLVVECCCYAWRESDKQISYTTLTTGPNENDRSGPFINMIQAVGQMITNPATTFKGETLKSDIERFEKLDAKRRLDDLALGEPQFGPGPLAPDS